MGSLNRVILIGHLGKDPEDRITPGGTRVSNFSMATHYLRSNNGNGEQKEVTEWHRIVAFGKLAEICNQYLRKGIQVCVEGSIQTRMWEKPPGERHYTTEVIAARVTLLDARGKSTPTAEITEMEPDPF